MKLTVQTVAKADTWKDIVRIPVDLRTDVDGNHVHRGTICRLIVGRESRYVIVRGLKNTTTATIQMDLTLRRALNVKHGECYDFQLKQVSRLGYLLFTWSASDPIYRVPAQLSLISFVLGSVLGLIGVVLGVIPLLHKAP